LTAENINGDLQRVRTITDGLDLPGMTAARPIVRSWIEPSVGTAGHRLAIQIAGFFERQNIGSITNDTTIQLFVRSIPSTLAGASSHAAGHVLSYYEGLTSEPVLRAGPSAIGNIDVQGGDIIVHNTTGGQWVVKSVGTAYLGGTNYAIMTAHSRGPEELYP